METVRQGRLYRLAKRLSLGRLLRYGALWARYGVRRGQSALLTRKAQAPGPASRPKRRRLARADLDDAKRMVVASWFPLDLANARLHRALLASVADGASRSRRHAGDPRLRREPQSRGRPHRGRRCHGRAGTPTADRQHRPLYASAPAPSRSVRNADDRRASSSPRPDRDPVRRRISEARPQDGSRADRGTDALYRRRQYAQGRLAHRDPAGGPVARLRACRQFRRSRRG